LGLGLLRREEFGESVVIRSSDVPEHRDEKREPEPFWNARGEFDAVYLELGCDVERVEKVASEDERVCRGVLISHHTSSEHTPRTEEGERQGGTYYGMDPPRRNDHRIPLYQLHLVDFIDRVPEPRVLLPLRTPGPTLVLFQVRERRPYKVEHFAPAKDVVVHLRAGAGN
jgi:hypothetical protein